MPWEIAVGVLLAVVALTLLPGAIRVLWILLDFATLMAFAYGTAIYMRQRGSQVPSTGTWWIDLGLALLAGWGLLFLLAMPIHELYHRVKHGAWDLWARREWWEHTLPIPLCQKCADDERVDREITKALRQRLTALPLWSRTLNDVIAMVKTLPSLVTA